ncbi:MAG: hypothetical protein Ct9H300mP1_18080 [Planctomycetaceae bacterium]|nr:MAG: hypothetical protein Ct9H300mP1_18080 [Planctomycetaceae bacterium]
MLLPAGRCSSPLRLARLSAPAGHSGPPATDSLLWRTADQLHYCAGEQVDRFQGRWRPDPKAQWPRGGRRAGAATRIRLATGER